MRVETGGASRTGGGGDSRNYAGVGHARLVHEAVVAVLAIAACAAGGLVHPAEHGPAHNVRHRQERAHPEFGGLGTFGLRVEALPRAVQAGETRVERRECPFGDHHRFLRAGVERVERLAHAAPIGGGRRDGVAVDVRHRVAVEGHDVAVCSCDVPHLVVTRAVDSGEAASHHEVVGVGRAHGLGGRLEVAAGDFQEKAALHFVGDRAGRVGAVGAHPVLGG